MRPTLSKRQSAVLEVMSKPKTPAEIRVQIGLMKTCNLTSAIKALGALDLIYCLNQKAKMGKLYGVTNKGKRVRKKLNFKEYHQPDDIDWDLYGWLVSGKQRRAILKAICDDCQISARLIRERAQEHNGHISRINTYDVLKEFSKAKLVQKKQVNHSVFFKLTPSGRKTRQQLLTK
jgi:predicted transcriptional regulator